MPLCTYLLLYYCFLFFFSTKDYGKTHDKICGMIPLKQITKSILLALSINILLFDFQWISAYSFNVSSALDVPSTVPFSDMFYRWSNWPFVCRYLLHIIYFLSSWLDLYYKLCLLLLRKPKDWYMEGTSGVNKTSLSTRVLGIRGCGLRKESLEKVPVQDLCANFFKGL